MSTNEPLPGHAEQLTPISGGTVILPLVIQDLEDRAAKGLKEHGVPLSTNNRRDALVDAYQEALDLAMYLRQAIEEKRQQLK